MVRALLGMLDTDALQILNINIDSIVADGAGNTNSNINTDATQESDAKQEMYNAVKYCANTTCISKSTKNRNRSTANTKANTLTKYFLMCPNYEIDKRKHTRNLICLMALGALKAHCHYSLNPMAGLIKCHHDV